MFGNRTDVLCIKFKLNNVLQKMTYTLVYLHFSYFCYNCGIFEGQLFSLHLILIFRVLYQEIDYINEGKNADRFRRDFRNVKWVRVPVCIFLAITLFASSPTCVC